MESMRPRDLTLEYVVGRLTEEAERRSDRQAELQERRSYSRGGQQQNLPMGQRQVWDLGMAVRRCYRCSQAGHLQCQCRARPPGDDMEQRQQLMQKCKQKGFSSGKKNTHSAHLVSAFSQEERKIPRGTWLLDSGSSRIICNSRKDFKTLGKPADGKDSIYLADGRRSKIDGQGTCFLQCFNTTLPETLFVSSLDYCLLSVSCLINAGYSVKFTQDGCLIKNGTQVCGHAKLENGLYVMQDKPVKAAQVVQDNLPVHKGCVHELHRKLGHANFHVLSEMQKVCKNLKVNSCNCFLDCNVCKMAKSKRKPMASKSDRVSKEVLQLVHCDVIGPFPQKTEGGARYAFLVTDDKSRFSWLFLLKQKSECFPTFREWVAQAEKLFARPVVQLQTDRGGDFLNKQFGAWLRRKGITHRLTNPYTPAENDLCERRGAVIQSVKDCLLVDAGLGNNHRLWGEAFLTANVLINRTWSSSIKDIPYCVLFGKEPEWTMLHNWGSWAHVNIPKAQRQKGGARVQRLRFVGYQPYGKGWHFNLRPERVVLS
ncbi:DDE-type integrase/transposase/recombinase [Podarcis lilfordi]|uniref:DDE-type integrase/transposase/recombinase n=1 Tax=Podarcis lilfordi TaxID=74358 RepID=A0AA35LJF1_9SAUR|nr:DDE-type integrase/transposase/recombinase [Podarcis lilfordi]